MGGDEFNGSVVPFLETCPLETVCSRTDHTYSIVVKVGITKCRRYPTRSYRREGYGRSRHVCVRVFLLRIKPVQECMAEEALVTKSTHLIKGGACLLE